MGRKRAGSPKPLPPTPPRTEVRFVAVGAPKPPTKPVFYALLAGAIVAPMIVLATMCRSVEPPRVDPSETRRLREEAIAREDAERAQELARAEAEAKMIVLEREPDPEPTPTPAKAHAHGKHKPAHPTEAKATPTPNGVVDPFAPTAKEAAAAAEEKAQKEKAAKLWADLEKRQAKEAARSESRRCCKHCNTGIPCGDSCISASKTCHQPPGCAC